MASRLKKLKVTSVDLCGHGANPDAYVRFYKCAETPENVSDSIDFDENEALKKAGVIEKAVDIILKKLGIKGFAQEKENERKDENNSEKKDKKKEEKKTMEIDKTKTPIEQPIEQQNGTSSASLANEMHPEVRKALDEMELVRKAQADEIEALKKSLEIERLTTFAKKYEIIGKKSGELAEKLYGLKKVGGTAYDDFVALLDEHLNTVEKSRLFEEIGRNTSGGLSEPLEMLNKMALEISKRDGITPQQAMEKAGMENPAIVEKYRREMA